MNRIVADTNVVISGLLWGGKPRQLLMLAATQQVILTTTEVLLDELLDVVSRPRFSTRLMNAGATPTALLADYRFLVNIVVPAKIQPAVIADPDDDAVLACAVAAGADFIASGDKHLLNLKSYQRIPIIAVDELLTLLGFR